jgi:hypothetical protein
MPDEAVPDRISDLLEELGYSPDGRREWWETPQKLLGGQTPGEVQAEGGGDEIVRLLQAMADGVYF